MLKTALMMTVIPVALSVTIPAKAAVDITGPILMENLPASIELPQTVGGNNVFNQSDKGSGPLALSQDPRITAGKSGAGRIILRPGPDSLASVMPEPTTWLMMLSGMAVVGWSLRGRRHNLRHVSFV